MTDSFHRIQIGFLNDVVCIDTTTQPSIKAEIDHAHDAISVQRERFRQNLLSSVTQPVKQFL